MAFAIWLKVSTTMQNTSLARRTFSLGLIAVAAGTLVACSKSNDAPAAAAPAQLSPAQMVDKIAATGKGFTVGAMMSANTVYVLFDPQCPHCGHLWQASVPLHNRVKFVWMPIAFINAKSAPQGAALLGAANPTEAMNAHEASILAGSGGTSASADVPADLAAAIQKNTELLNRMGVGSVPHIVTKNPGNGQVITKTGALDTAQLTAFLGLN